MQKFIHGFIRQEVAGGLILMLMVVIAMIWANSPWVESYHALWSLKIKFGATIQGVFYGLHKPLVLWINDALMALFFLLMGLEIKREFLVGELSTRAKMLQPLLGAIGGMIVPALVYIGFTFQHDILWHGWAIPCATDIAFALGVLALVGSRVPYRVKVLLTAIAVIDDLLAIVIIALFYSTAIQWDYLFLALSGMAMLVALNHFGVRRLALYILAGIIVWIGLLKAGIHPTLAGVMTAFAIPLQGPGAQTKAPLIRFEHALHPWVIFVVLPIFALANGGLSVSGLHVADMLGALPMGVGLGLLIGKPLGIMTGLWVGHVTGLARHTYPWRDDWGMAILCGVGFTMALFIGDLAFDNHLLVNEAKLGILSASLLSAGIGWVVCRLTFYRNAQRG